MEALGINLGYLIIQLLGMGVCIGVIGMVVFLVVRRVNGSSGHREQG